MSACSKHSVVMFSLKAKTLLVIAAHPDDEIYGCGCLISKIKEHGGKVFVLFITNGTTKEFSSRGVSTEKAREKEIKNVAKFLRYDDYKIAFPGNHYHLQLDKLGQKKLINEIENGRRISLESTKPDILAFHSFEDYNQDHAATAKAAFAACRPTLKKDRFVPDLILSYEEPMDIWTQGRAEKLNFYVEISKAGVNNKLNALRLYKSQMKEKGHPRSLDVVKSLARVRGSTIGKEFAEGFYCHKIKV